MTKAKVAEFAVEIPEQWVAFHRVSIERYVYGDLFWDAVYERGAEYNSLIEAIEKELDFDSGVFDMAPRVRFVEGEVQFASSIPSNTDETMPVLLLVHAPTKDTERIQRSYRRTDAF